MKKKLMLMLLAWAFTTRVWCKWRLAMPQKRRRSFRVHAFYCLFWRLIWTFLIYNKRGR